MMHSRKSIFYAVTIVFFSLWVPSVFCFAQNDNDNEEQAIEFDFATGRFKQVFPFDQFFTIKLKNIDPNATSVKIRIYEYPVNVKYAKGRTYTPEDLESSSVVLEANDWIRPAGSNTTEGYVVIPYKLRHNFKFIVAVLPGKERPLTSAEQTDLANKLTGNPALVSMINVITQKYIANPEPLPSYVLLNVSQREFNELANKAVKNIDSNYRVKQIDAVAQLTDIIRSVSDFVDLENALTGIEGDAIFKAQANKAVIQTTIDQLRTKLKQINWGSVKSTDAEFQQLTTIAGNIFSPFAIALPLTLQNKQAAVNNFFTTVLTNRDTWYNNVTANIIATNTVKYEALNATYRADFVKNSKLYITLDVGISYVWRMDRFVAYSGVNIYFRPIDRTIPLGNYRGWDHISTRTSLLVGVSLTSVQKDSVRKGLFGNSAGVLGLGYRVFPFMKVNAGSMIYYSYSSNPMISKERYYTTFSPFVSLSIDLDVKPLFSGIGEAIFK